MRVVSVYFTRRKFTQVWKKKKKKRIQRRCSVARRLYTVYSFYREIENSTQRFFGIVFVYYIYNV